MIYIQEDASVADEADFIPRSGDLTDEEDVEAADSLDEDWLQEEFLILNTKVDALAKRLQEQEKAQVKREALWTARFVAFCKYWGIESELNVELAEPPADLGAIQGDGGVVDQGVGEESVQLMSEDERMSPADQSSFLPRVESGSSRRGEFINLRAYLSWRKLRFDSYLRPSCGSTWPSAAHNRSTSRADGSDRDFS